MSYATAEQFRAWFAGDGARMSSFLRVPPSGEKAQIDALLGAASARMDGAFRAAGYALPLDLAAAGDFRPELEALLQKRCVDLAILELSPGLAVDLQGNVELSRSERWLAELVGTQTIDGATGRVVRAYATTHLPGLPRVD